MAQALTHPTPASLANEEHLVLEDASWELYEALLKEIGDRAVRVTYDKGRMEIMSPLPEHETEKKIIGRMIERLTEELDIPTLSYGSTTLRQKLKAKGLEPDECYYFKHETRMRGRKRMDLKKDPPPELAVEVDVTSRSVPRLPIYAALGVPEVWRYGGRKLHCLHLIDGTYHARKMSLVFPFLEPASLQQFIELVPIEGETAVIRRFAAWVRNQGWSK